MTGLPTLCEVAYGSPVVSPEISLGVPYRLASQKPVSPASGLLSPRYGDLQIGEERRTVGCRTPGATYSSLGKASHLINGYSPGGVRPPPAWYDGFDHDDIAYYYTHPPSPHPNKFNSNDQGAGTTRSKRERARTAPLVSSQDSLPTLSRRHHIQHSSLGRLKAEGDQLAWINHHMERLVADEKREDEVGLEPDDEWPSRQVGNKKVKWIPALNAWVDESQTTNSASFTSFCNGISLSDRGYTSADALDHDIPNKPPCDRYNSHMHGSEQAAKIMLARKKAEAARMHEKWLERLAAIQQKRNTPKAPPQRKRPKNPPSVTYQPPAPPPRIPTPEPIQTLPSIVSPSPPQTSVSTQPEVIVEEEPEAPVDVNETGWIEEEVEEEAEEKGESLRESTPDESPSLEEEVVLQVVERKSSPLPRIVTPHIPTPSPPTPPPTPPSPPLVTTVQQPPGSDTKTSQPKRKPPAALSKPKPIKPPQTSKELPKTIRPQPGLRQTDSLKDSKRKHHSVGGSDTGNLVEDDKKSSCHVTPTATPDIVSNGRLSNKTPRADKRARWKAKAASKAKPKLPPPDPVFNRKDRPDWIYGDDDFSTELPAEPPESTTIELAEPPPPPTITTPPPTTPPSTKKMAPSSLPKKLPDWARKRLGPKRLDTSMSDELRKQQLAEERRKKAMEMYEKLKGKKYKENDSEEMGDNPNFNDYGWLAKYCILNRTNMEMFKGAFEAVDDEQKGRLNSVETMIALRAVNSKLSVMEEEYIYRILEMVGYSVTDGADLKLFSLMAALSARITSLDEWMRTMLSKIDLKMLSRKVFQCKSLWECNVDEETKQISVNQLCVDLRAGGVSLEHEEEVREKLAPLQALDLLDFLTYVPLFIMIHQSVVHNPLDDTRDK